MIDGIRSSAGAPRRRKKSTIRSWSTRLFAMVVKSGVVCGAQRRMCGLARDVEIAKNTFHRSSGRFTNKLREYEPAASTLQVTKVSTPRSGDLDMVHSSRWTKGKANWKMNLCSLVNETRNQPDTFVENEKKGGGRQHGSGQDHDRNAINIKKKTLKNENKQPFCLNLRMSLDFTGDGGAFVATLLKRRVAAVRLRAASMSVLTALLGGVSWSLT